jgi:hypothetical protein
VSAAVVRVVGGDDGARRPGGAADREGVAKRTGSVELSMNCGMPTESAVRRPCPSRMVALRSLLWFRMGVVAVRDT